MFIEMMCWNFKEFSVGFFWCCFFLFLDIAIIIQNNVLNLHRYLLLQFWFFFFKKNSLVVPVLELMIFCCYTFNLMCWTNTLKFQLLFTFKTVEIHFKLLRFSFAVEKIQIELSADKFFFKWEDELINCKLASFRIFYCVSERMCRIFIQ